MHQEGVTTTAHMPITDRPITRAHITPLQSLIPPFAMHFRGHDARPLKTLYLQPCDTPQNLDVAKQLQSIGLQEGFQVFIQLGKRLFQNPSGMSSRMISGSNPNISRWGQDNKLILKGPDGQNVVLIPPRLDFDPGAELGIQQGRLDEVKEQRYGRYLAKAANLKHRTIASYLEGGNVFLGKLPDNSSFALIGEDSIRLNARRIAKHTDTYLTNETHFNLLAKKAIAEDLHITEDKLFSIPQPEFHIDMAIRPLGFPLVLVHDPTQAVSLLDEALAISPVRDERRRLKKLRKLTLNTEKQRLESGYQPMPLVAEALKRHGFDIITLPSLFGSDKGEVANFTNALVHTKMLGNGKKSLVYITNDTGFPTLNSLFAAKLKQLAPFVSRVEFISGGTMSQRAGDTYLKECLQLSGGVHCLTSEEPG
ncbi:MAG: hypothetical protein K2X01_05520 [Cyanobacteria bacterium]|nr:hypothetical protein [Cyanobacteriota bacterium]